MPPLLILDPGHGGIDPGGGSNSFFTEKDKNLQISLYQFNRFQSLNIPVAITRTADTTLSSEERASRVRNSGARYCISNHINVGGGRGSEVIYSIFGSAAFPRLIQDDLEAAGMPNRRIFTRTLPDNPRKDYYFMHRETGSVETVIVEYGFADNPLDADILHRNWHQLAEAVVMAFCAYTGHPYKQPAPPNPSNGSGTGMPDGGTNIPAWKQEAIDWLFQEGLLTNEDWRHQPDTPLPLWAEAVILKRLYEKLRNPQ
ncbi:N-acetylmuramoyl-L-alanine amidase [Brevibacillus ruminantium]|uniref:N-acetylmuramoyl-L-alanine amidase n=1 Tax=Brevibacillus ruminantium TaxID=2950604 RepID=A0ABY4WD32_9BACL|nr:N-acetylmuramoyl-L-alanine amidase [Brevibacillus ruminantium]USG64756.1 N-acetylmuramoyl-L-alanine amidase [Brevibacillus ruminantium]